MEHGAPLQRRTTLSSRSRSAASVRRAGPMCPAAAHVFSAGHAGPALQGTGRVRADRVVRPYSGSRSRAKRDVVPQGHLFRCAPLRDAVPYERFAVPIRRAGPMCPAAAHAFSAGHAGPALQGTGHVRADRVVRPYDGLPCVRRGGLTMAGHKRCAFIVPSGAPAAPYK